jgi:sporulation protein YlmC with PRC-barrel domain
MFKPMSKPLLPMALVAAIGITGAQAQTATTPNGTASQTPSIAVPATAPTGADARKLLGRNIKTAENETVGEIRSIHLAADGKVDAVIASVGGFLGIGDREVLLDWRDLKIDENGERIRTTITKDELKAKAPYTYKDQSLRGTVFTDGGIWMDHARTPNSQAANTTTTTRSTGDFNVAGQMSAEALVGKTVKNAANESVGKINDVYLDADGAVKLVVVSVGGFLGVGSKDVGVPWSDLKLGRDGNSITVLTGWTKESLKAMPDYKDERRITTGGARSSGD